MKKSISILAAVLLIAALFVGCNAETNSAKLVTVGFNVGDGASKALVSASGNTTATIDHYSIRVTDNSNNTYRYLRFYNGNTVQNNVAENAIVTSGDGFHGTTHWAASADDATTYIFENVTVATQSGTPVTDGTLSGAKFVLSQGVWTFEVKGFDSTNKLIAEGKLANVRISNATASVTMTVGESYEATGEFVDLTITFGAAVTSDNKPETYAKTPTSSDSGYFTLTVDKVEDTSSDAGASKDGTALTINTLVSAYTAGDGKDYYIERNADNNTYLMGSATYSVPTGWRTIRLTYTDGTTVFKVYEKKMLVTKAGEWKIQNDLVGEFGTPTYSITQKTLTLGALSIKSETTDTIGVPTIKFTPDAASDSTINYSIEWTVDGLAYNTESGHELTLSTNNAAAIADLTDLTLTNYVKDGQYLVICVVTVTERISGQTLTYKAVTSEEFQWAGDTPELSMTLGNSSTASGS